MFNASPDAVILDLMLPDMSGRGKRRFVAALFACGYGVKLDLR
jgi:hypothetical protein